VGWLPDLDGWAEIISHFLNPGGIFFIVDFHPFIRMFNRDYDKIIYSYFNTGAIIEESKGTYADRNAELSHTSCGWNHSMSDILSSLIRNSLRIESFEEYPLSTYNRFEKSDNNKHGNWEIAGMDDKIPMMYSIKAVKK
jgi:hypothetical protein